MPTIHLPDKICSCCNGTYWYYKPSSPNHLYCPTKRKEQNKKRYENTKNNPDVIAKKKVWMKNWRTSNKDHIREYKLKYDKTEKGKDAKRRRGSYAIDGLRDYYVRNVLSANLPLKLSKEDIPQNLIDIEKKNLTLKREIGATSYSRRGKNILIIPDKVCSHCGDTRWRIDKYSSNGFRYRCVNQSNEWSKNARENKKLQVNNYQIN